MVCIICGIERSICSVGVCWVCATEPPKTAEEKMRLARERARLVPIHKKKEYQAKAKERHRKRLVADPLYREKLRARSREKYRKDPRKAIDYMKQYHRDHPEVSRNKHLKKRFGLTPQRYEAILKSQGGVCAICKGPETRATNGKTAPRGGKGYRLSVDHCHRVGVVRGLLCMRCNVGLGNFMDDPERLMAAYEYLIGKVALALKKA